MHVAGHEDILFSVRSLKTSTGYVGISRYLRHIVHSTMHID